MIDSLKGYACFLVLFGHVIMGIRKAGVDAPLYVEWIEQFIWTFHVALFMFLSGYVYRLTGEWRSKNGRIAFLKHKFVNLAVPYFVFSSVYICINSIIGGSNVNNAAEIADILWLWKESVAQYWFLYDLFFLFVAFVVLGRWFKNWQITVILFIAKIVVTVIFKTTLPEPFDSMVSMALPFGIGTCFEKLYFDNQVIYKRIALISAHILLTVIALYYSLDQNVIIDSLLSIIGIIASISFVSIIIKNEQINKASLFVCKYSFHIYILHTIFTAGIRVVLNKCGIDSYWLHVIVGTTFGLATSIMIGWISEKIDILNFFFFPGRVMDKLRKKKKEKTE